MFRFFNNDNYSIDQWFIYDSASETSKNDKLPVALSHKHGKACAKHAQRTTAMSCAYTLAQVPLVVKASNNYIAFRDRVHYIAF